MKKTTFTLLAMGAILMGSLIAAPNKLSKVERAQARVAKLQAESDCLLKLVDDKDVSKADLAEIMLNDGTCLNHIKRINKAGK